MRLAFPFCPTSFASLLQRLWMRVFRNYLHYSSPSKPYMKLHYSQRSYFPISSSFLWLHFTLSSSARTCTRKQDGIHNALSSPFSLNHYMTDFYLFINVFSSALLVLELQTHFSFLFIFMLAPYWKHRRLDKLDMDGRPCRSKEKEGELSRV